MHRASASYPNANELVIFVMISAKSKSLVRKQKRNFEIKGTKWKRFFPKFWSHKRSHLVKSRAVWYSLSVKLLHEGKWKLTCWTRKKLRFFVSSVRFVGKANKNKNIYACEGRSVLSALPGRKIDMKNIKFIIWSWSSIQQNATDLKFLGPCNQQV